MWGVLVAISIPIFTSQLEKSREATGEYTETGATPDVLDAAEKSKHIRKQD